MKAKFIQRMMACVLTVALVASPSMSVLVTSANPGTGSSVSGNSTGSATAEDEVVAIINESNDGGSSISSIAEIPVTNTVAGTKSTV